MASAALNTQAIALSEANLPRLPESVDLPSYDRATLHPGIVHIGLGNFHRAHQAWYIHRLMQEGLAKDWAIIGASVRQQDQTMRDRLIAQDCLTTLIELSPKGRSAEIIGSMIDYLPIEKDHSALIAKMSDPDIRIVSLTITEGGYFISANKGGLDTDHPDIRHDIANPGSPRTVFGAIVAALDKRRQSGVGPITVLSCDNLRGNGDITRSAVTGLAKRIDPDLGNWISEQCSFPNSMVDCIVPATGPSELALAHGFGIDDAAPVTHENYRQWVIEDDFCVGRPELEHVGVIITPDVEAYEAMKIRILNAGHQVLANVGELLGLETIADCMAHPVVSRFFHKIEQEEIAPYVSAVPGMTPPKYVQLVAQRFSNPAIQDTTRRVAFDGSSRHSEFLLPIIRDALNAGGSIEGLALVEALWARMCAGTRDDGTDIFENDPDWARLTEVAQQSAQRPITWLEQSHIYGNLVEHPSFAPAFCSWLDRIWSEGSVAALQAYLR
ncbi:mannitol dehydrogenase family protein [Cognatishimia activa]|uniref:Mannitol 2-dehydrogenase n=1 Tax=Cognatishimia activa TaxID=1715691 RepID=A0A0P1IMF2_9RHOB|nr:mannitol dehydrogenase family protein [Cognatishimia activa]CUI33389.1 Mannitol 2-dehydrogenase [Cognatishimia activa]CUK24783.1 Mannitol 2-dehydrogenase [Cognatishimia activa]